MSNRGCPHEFGEHEKKKSPRGDGGLPGGVRFTQSVTMTTSHLNIRAVARVLALGSYWMDGPAKDAACHGSSQAMILTHVLSDLGRLS